MISPRRLALDPPVVDVLEDVRLLGLGDFLPLRVARADEAALQLVRCETSVRQKPAARDLRAQLVVGARATAFTGYLHPRVAAVGSRAAKCEDRRGGLVGRQPFEWRRQLVLECQRPALVPTRSFDHLLDVVQPHRGQAVGVRNAPLILEGEGDFLAADLIGLGHVGAVAAQELGGCHCASISENQRPS